MKTLFLIIIYFLIINIYTNAQQGWLWQNPLPQGTTLNSVEFISSTTGWAVGDAGTILKTTDGGTSWSLQTSGTEQVLKDVSIINLNRVIVVGTYGTILNTKSIVKQFSNNNEFLKINFFEIHNIDQVHFKRLNITL